MEYYDYKTTVSRMLGLTMTRVERGNDGNSDTLTFEAENGLTFVLYYEPDCCATCDIESITGDLSDLIGSPLLMAEEATSSERPADVAIPPYEPESQTWTFYKFATVKGYVDVRWFGESNGYYSESVSFRCSERLCHVHEDCKDHIDLARACRKMSA